MRVSSGLMLFLALADCSVYCQVKPQSADPEKMRIVSILYAQDSKPANSQLNMASAEQQRLIGDFFFSKGNDIAAIARYKEAIKLQPDLKAAHDGLGRSLERMGKYDEAISVYQDFISRFPDSPAISEFKARIAEIYLAKVRKTLDNRK